MELMTIGEFSKRSRLSAKALRLYDEMGLLPPAEVVAELWAHAEVERNARSELAAYLISQLNGKELVMYEVSTREILERTVLCLKRNVGGGDAGAWAFGKEFISLIKGKDLPRIEGRTGASFLIWWGLVNEDSDRPLEFCLPVPADQAEALALRIPELSVRTEPAHKEAFVALGAPVVPPAEYELISQSLQSWAAANAAKPSDLGVRTTYLTTPPITAESVPDIDFAVPFA